MATEKARREHEVFVAALDLDPAPLSAFLDEACRGDPGMRARVMRLLAATSETTAFLESPAITLDRLSVIDSPAAFEPHCIDGYRLLGLLGSGGMASVYEAEQDHPSRRVALKIMHRLLAQTEAAQRFAFETQALARLRHPAIAAIYEAGTFKDSAGNELPFFAMEYIAGAKPIDRFVQDASLPLRDRLAMFADVCDAVHHGHQLGIIHRDLKPSNILVDQAGSPHIIDFGIARSVEAQGTERITVEHDTRALIGTLNFMSPEQCLGSQQVDIRTDIFSLGVVLYQLVAGRLPHALHQVSIPSAINTIVHDEPPRPSNFEPLAAGDLDAIIGMAIAKDASRRYASAESFGADVRRFLAHKTVQARLPSPMHHVRLFARRHRVLVAMAAVMILTVFSSTGIIGTLGYKAWRESGLRIEAERTAIAERNLARRQAYTAALASGYSSYRVREFTRARESLDLAPVPMRGWEWSLVSSLADRGEQVINAHDDQLTMSFAPAARRIATISRDGSLALWDADQGTRIAHTAPGNFTYSNALTMLPDATAVFFPSGSSSLGRWLPHSPDSPQDVIDLGSPAVWLACSSAGVLAVTLANRSLLIIDPASMTIINHRRDLGPISGASFSADGSECIVWARDGRITLLDAHAHTTLDSFDLGISANYATTSLDRSLLTAGGAEGRFRVWDRSTREILLDANTLPSISTIRALAFSPDSASLFVGQVDRSITRWSLDQPGEKVAFPGHDEAVNSLEFDHIASRLVSASWDGTIRFWPHDERRASAPMVLLQAHNANVLSLAFSPDGSLLASASSDNLVRLWEPDLGLNLATLAGHRGVVYQVQFSPDGSMLASASADGTVRLWSTTTGLPLHDLPPAGVALWTLAFSPDSRSLWAAGEGGTVHRWDLEANQHQQVLQTDQKRVIRLRFSPDGRTLVTCGRDATVKLWDVSTTTLRHTLANHRLDVFDAVFSHDGQLLYTGSRDQTVRVWSTVSGQQQTVVHRRGQFITSLALHPDGTRLAAGSWFADVSIFDTASLQPLLAFPGQNSAIRSIAFSPSGTMLACAGHDGTVALYDARPRAEIAESRTTARALLDRSIAHLAPTLEASPGIMRNDADARRLIARDQTDTPSLWLRNALLKAAHPEPMAREADDN